MTKKRTFWANLSASRPLHNHKGFSLIELVVTMGIIGILLLSSVAIFSTVSKAFSSTQVRNQQQMLLDGMIEAISTQLRYATDVELTSASYGDIYTDGDNLFISAVSPTEAALSWKNYNAEFKFQALDEYTLSLEITLSDKYDDIVTKEEAAIRLINCELKENPLDIASGANSAVTFTLPS